MSIENHSQIISEDFRTFLATHYPEHLVGQLTDIQTVSVPYTTEAQIPYTRINKGGSRPTMLVHGFTQGIVAEAGFALELARDDAGLSGRDVILPDQQRVGFLEDGKRDEKGRLVNNATETLALGYLAILEKEVPEGPIDIIAHSYGALVFQSMQRIARERADNGGTNIFDGANVMMIAPAGGHQKESLLRLGRRFGHHSIKELFSPKALMDPAKEMLKAEPDIAKINVKRTWKEVLALAKERLNYREILDGGVNALAVAVFGKDDLYHDGVLKQQIEGINTHATDNGLRGVEYLTPVQFDADTQGAARQKGEKRARLSVGLLSVIPAPLRKRMGAPSVSKDEPARKLRPRKVSIKGATHNDEMYNPKRVARAVKQYLELL